MDFLFDNPLANMPGGWFLLLYGTVVILTALTVKIYKSSLDWTSKLQLPPVPQNPNPFEVAFLRGGENEFARSLIFALVQKGFLEISTGGKKSFIRLTPNQPNWTTLSPVERNVLPWFQVTRETKEVFASGGVTSILKPYSATYDQQLARHNFLTPNDVTVKTRLLGFMAGSAVIGLGLYKMLSALYHGRYNFAFLLIFMVVATIIFYVLSKTPRLSALGKRYVERIQQAFENLKAKVKRANGDDSPEYAMAAVDPFLLAVGVFGIGTLSGTLYNDYEQAFHRASSSSGSSSCGSGCGSSGGCSSGGDGGGGGGCGGGGCGGCGGGCS